MDSRVAISGASCACNSEIVERMPVAFRVAFSLDSCDVKEEKLETIVKQQTELVV